MNEPSDSGFTVASRLDETQKDQAVSQWLNSRPGATAFHSLEVEAYKWEDNLSPLKSKPSSFFFDDLALKQFIVASSAADRSPSLWSRDALSGDVNSNSLGSWVLQQ